MNTAPTIGTSMSKRHTLIVEDEAAIRELVRLHLALEGFEVMEVGDGRRALEIARSLRFDLIVIDVMLPGIDGITLCRALRADGVNISTPMLMLTARDTESDKVLGLESGADDYVTKHFGMREMVARVGALLRRHARQTDACDTARVLDRREVTLHLDKRHAVVRGLSVELTKQEFDLLHLLLAHPGVVFSRESLLASVWRGDTFVTERTVDSVVSRLRKKIEREPQNPDLILTAWGLGYKFVDVG
jgi:DNA-binding response OmpR family regulator